MTTPTRVRPRCGYSLIELVVAIAIIGILVGLLLTAVSASRSAAARLSCQNNLANLGKGVANYLTVNKTYPIFDWPEAISPFVEATNVRQSGANATPAPKLFMCPADEPFQVAGQGPCP